MNINRDYLIINDVKKSNIKLDNGSMFFYITDKNTQNIFVNLVINVSNNDLIQKYANIENAEDYTLTMNIVKPDNTYKIIEGKLHDKEKAIFEFNLNEDCCDEIGTYRCELLTKCNINDHEEITTSNKLTYKVKSSVLNDLDDIVEAPEYPLVIQLFDKLSDIEQYEENRRANELARQLAEEQRQTRFNALDTDMVDSIQAIDNKVEDVENRISAKEQAVDKLIVDTKADIDGYKVAKDQEIDEYKTAKDAEINNAITAQDNKIDEAIANQDTRIDTAIAEQNNRIETVEASNNTQNTRLDALEAKDIAHETSITNIEAKNVEQDNRLDSIEAVNVSQDNRLDAIEIKNQQQDDRLLDVEKVNKRQDMDLKCLFAESKNNMIDIAEEGNSIYLQNSTIGYTLIDEIKGNTLVNCNKEPDKEIILNGNINTQGYSNVTLTEGVDGGLVDVALEGNTMVNVCDQKDPVAITKSYTVETGNHVALQGEYDGKCRPVVTGNTLWIDNNTGEILTTFDNTKNLRLQSSFEDKVVTQEMVDNGEELAENLGKYRADYKVTGKNKAGKLLNYNTTGGNKYSTTLIEDTTGNIKGYLFKAQPNINYVFTKDREDSRFRVFFFRENPILDRTQLSIEGSYADNYKTIRITTPSNTKYGYLVATGNYSTNPFSWCQIEEGDTATPYEPYKEYKKTFYLNNPLLEGDTIEQQGDNVVHVHRSEIRAYETDDELTLPTDKTNTLVAKATPQYEVISQNDTILCDSYTNGHLDVDSVIPIERVKFRDVSVDLKYKYQGTDYNIQFESDNVGIVKFYFDAWHSYNSVVKGMNKFTLTSKPEGTVGIAPYISFEGIGFNASNIVVTEATDQEFGYFEGMKSVGECEDLAITSSNSDGTSSNTQTLTHEPLRAVGDIKDKYVLIDGKWYIERNCGTTVSSCKKLTDDAFKGVIVLLKNRKDRTVPLCDSSKYVSSGVITPDTYYTNPGNIVFVFDLNDSRSFEELVNLVKTYNFVYELASPTYEPIDYNPFEVYGEVTCISNNSTIPCNMTIKNTGYNCLLKPNTTYTVSSNLGLNVVTTPSTLTEDCLRFMDTDTSDVTTMKDVTILEGDYTTGKPLPSHFSGIESAFEQEYDEEKGKYKVKIRVQNEDASKENYIEFYINEPLRGIGDVKDKVYVKNDKVVVERNCGSVTLDGSEDENWSMQRDIYGKYRVFNSNKYTYNNRYSYGYSKYFPSVPYGAIGYNYTGEGCGLENNNLRISIANAKLSSVTVAGFKQWLQQNPTTVVYQLAEPTYEEVEYNDVKLFIESFKNSTLFYNSNIPVTSKLYYSYSVPIVDAVSQTANVTDQQDSMIIDLATQVAVMEMMLM